MTTLLLVRHGETDWNRSGQIMGEQPIPLNQNGEADAQRLADLLRSRSLRTIYSSPVLRARQTAEILASAVRLPVRVDRGLTEINVGEWVGRFWRELTDDLVRRNFYSNPQDSRPPGGETLREVQTRVVSFVEGAMAEALSTSGDTGPLLLVSHADVVRAIIAHYLQWDLQTIRQVRIDHASLTALKVADGLADLLFLNHTATLQSLK